MTVSLHSRKGGTDETLPTPHGRVSCSGSCCFMDQEALLSLPVLFGTELPMSTGSRGAGLGELKAIVSPAATTTSKHHRCAEMSLRHICEGGTTSQDEGESMETAAQPRTSRSPRAIAVSQLITAGKAISRPWKSFSSVFPGTWVTLGCSSWGHHVVLQPPLTRAARGEWKPYGSQRPAPCWGEHSKASALASSL